MRSQKCRPQITANKIKSDDLSTMFWIWLGPFLSAFCGFVQISQSLQMVFSSKSNQMAQSGCFILPWNDSTWLQPSGKKSLLNINTKSPTVRLLIKALLYHPLLDQDIKSEPYPTKWSRPGHKQVHYWIKTAIFWRLTGPSCISISTRTWVHSEN